MSSRLLQEVVEQNLRQSPGIEVITQHVDRSQLHEAVARQKANVVILGLKDSEDIPAECAKLQERMPNVVVVGVVAEGRRVVVGMVERGRRITWHNGSIGLQELLDTLRAATVHTREPRA